MMDYDALWELLALTVSAALGFGILVGAVFAFLRKLS